MMRRKSGFTLIEVLVVVAIIAILAGILVPVMAKVRGSARAANCISNLNQIGKAYRMYLQDYDQCIPPAINEYDRYAYGWPAGIPRDNIRVALMNYVREEGIWQDPGDTGAHPDNALGQEVASYYEVFGTSYCYYPAFWFRNARVLGPLMETSLYGNINMQNSYSNAILFNDGGHGMLTNHCRNQPREVWSLYAPASWHQDDSVTVLFRDGHAKRISTSEYVQSRAYTFIGNSN
ncbi:MAG: prepilin-type N-terminal cleavage/methylation domain-containing protein [Armatimonadetes bacterium]|nr:prepilin-type N-terminal cleavage/methylation domain-containing protein [Armatimonadota bacterium]